ncbi:STN domain-containing protein [Sphingomonas sp. MMS24-J13]|uniref:STN domain-containing protein n=1 Tax=Sphingomonas sp. MMS24-J13 TaxID=3238686 RepID=UPI00384E4888
MACALFLLAPGELTAAPVAPPESQVRFDIPAGPAETALAAMAQAAGISIGWENGAPAFPVKHLSGTMTPAKALRRMLSGSGYQAVRVGPTAYRIQRPIAVLPPPGGAHAAQARAAAGDRARAGAADRVAAQRDRRHGTEAITAGG